MVIVAFCSLLETIKWDKASILSNSPTNLSPTKTASPKFSILFSVSIGVSSAL